jgi:hypothetical protein
MIYSELDTVISICHIADIPLFIWGPRGVGKSNGVKKFCKDRFHFYDENGKGTVPFFSKDMRAAQMEASELRGLPKADGDKFIYLPPVDLPHGNFIDEKGNTWGKNSDVMPEVSPFYEKFAESFKSSLTENSQENLDKIWPFKGKVKYHQGILFLDEVNRGEDDVLQALFELILDRKTGAYELPSKILIIGAGNPSGSRYRTNTFVSDAAFTSRWCHVSIQINEEYITDWMKWMKLTNIDDSITDKITQFCAGSNDHLIQTEDGSEQLIIEPNPRSWEFVSRIEDSVKKNTDIFKDDEQKDRIRTELLQGLIGISVTNAYKNWAAEIYPRDILENGTSPKITQILHTMKRPEMQGLMLGVVNIATSSKDPLQKHIDNVLSFCKWMVNNNNYKDLAVGFCRGLTNNELESSLKGAALINPSIQRILNKQTKTRIWYNALTKDPILSREIQITAWGSEIKLNK